MFRLVNQFCPIQICLSGRSGSTLAFSGGIFIHVTEQGNKQHDNLSIINVPEVIIVCKLLGIQLPFWQKRLQIQVI